MSQKNVINRYSMKYWVIAGALEPVYNLFGRTVINAGKDKM